MRVSSTMLTRQAMLNIENSYSKVAKTSSQVSSGKKFSNASESPTEAHLINSLKIERKEIYQYFSNINNSKMVAEDTEIAIRDINESIQRVKELTSYALSGTVSLTDREAICQEIEQCKEQIISNLNATSSGKYIFGGFNSKFAPVNKNGDVYEFNGVSLTAMTSTQKDSFLNENIVVSISHGVSVNLKMSALEIIGTGDDNLINNIDQLISGMKTEPLDTEAMKTESKLLEEHFNHVLVNITKTGAVSNRLEAIEAHLINKEEAVKSKISNLEDIDIEEAILNYKLAEQAYNATLAISGKAIQLSLMDFMR